MGWEDRGFRWGTRAEHRRIAEIAGARSRTEMEMFGTMRCPLETAEVIVIVEGQSHYLYSLIEVSNCKAGVRLAGVGYYLRVL